ncbi:Transcription factor MYB1R1 [Apostasia shenzhenica]|uniref:Transcription factor MYB1R1 n=1 Tax=Apostasia shenzhenica TaxID=1088818 RepID=A0A2I0BEV4_9ASPA|nr:Transcription factor MYB1R1 [Apostasia shenzhenica]
MARRCSHCNNDGHNSRTCPNLGVRLFGVRLTDGSIRKSASTGNLAGYARSPAAGGSPDPSAAAAACGYASDVCHGGSGSGSGSGSRERKRGVPWTEHEHKMFLLGLKKLGKGDWRGISRNYVITRTPTQVASHAQKYFIRHSCLNRRKKRASLFDIVTDESPFDEHFPSPTISQEREAQTSSSLSLLKPSGEQAVTKKDHSTTEMEAAEPPPPAVIHYTYPPPVYPGFFFPVFPYPVPCWPAYAARTADSESHEIIKPTAIHLKSSIHVDDNFGISELSLFGCHGAGEQAAVAPKFAQMPERPSAFHASGANDSSSSAVQAL